MIRYNAGEPRAKRSSRSVGLYVMFGVSVAVYIFMHAVKPLYIAGSQPTPPPIAVSDFMVKSIIRDVIPVEDGKLEVHVAIDIKDLVKVMGHMYGADTSNDQLPANVSYVMHNPRLCSDASSLKYIVYLHSAPGNSERRDLVRQTWGNRRLLKDKNSRVVFLLGLPKDYETQQKLRAEFAQHGDIVQGNFHDAYRNLTLKGIMGLKWISTYCAQAQYVLKSDDDAFVNIFSLLGVMDGNTDKKRLIACVSYKEGSMGILRYPKKCSKWCIKYHEMIGRRVYPRYCAGLAFLLSREMVPEMYIASLKTPFFWVDDAYVSGLLPSKVIGVEYLPLKAHFTFSVRDVKVFLKSAMKDLKHHFTHGTTIKQRVEMWNALLRKLNDTQKALLSEDVITNSTLLLSRYTAPTTTKLPRVKKLPRFKKLARVKKIHSK